MTPLLDRINAARRERGLDADDPFAGDDELWAPEDLAATDLSLLEQPEGTAIAGVVFGLFVSATAWLVLGGLAYAIVNTL